MRIWIIAALCENFFHSLDNIQLTFWAVQVSLCSSVNSLLQKQRELEELRFLASRSIVVPAVMTSRVF